MNTATEQSATELLAQMAQRPLPVRVTEPTLVQLVRRLVATGQLQAQFTSDQRFADVLEIMPLGRKVIKCMRTG